MVTDITLNDENKSIIIRSGDHPYRILFEIENEGLYDLMQTLPKNKQLETIAFRGGYELLGLHPEHDVGSHEYERYYKVKHGDTVIDAGAHVGIWTEIFSDAVDSDGSVVAFEPDFRALGYLVPNMYYRKNVHVVPLGLWNESDFLPFGIDKHLGVSSYLNWVGNTSNPGYQLTKVDTLDNYLKELYINKVNLIKMDVEGAEVRALEGATNILKNTEALAIATYHKTMEHPDNTTKKVAEILEDAGFDVRIEFSDGEIVYANRGK